MKITKINLLDKETEFGFMPTLTGYILDGSRTIEKEDRPAVLVIPGGGYSIVSPREGERIALSYNAAGFHAFILDYCVAPHIHPLPILNAAKAIEIIRDNAKEWRINPDMVAVCGFSAGGHLAGSISTLWNSKEIFGDDEAKNRYHRPDASILCYPVITCGDYAHKNSFKNLTGMEECEFWNTLSLENCVDETTPETFLWHTFADMSVPVENSLLYANALRKHQIPFELHIYPDGPHGTSLFSHETHWGLSLMEARSYPWMKQSIEWLYLKFGITEATMR